MAPVSPPNIQPPREKQLDGDCAGRAVTSLLAGLFEDTYSSLANDLCDPFQRRIQSISCDDGTVSGTSGSATCNIQFRCSGPCGEWIDSTAIYQSQEEYTTSTSCTCDVPGGNKRALLSANHIAAMNAALGGGVSITSIRV